MLVTFLRVGWNSWNHYHGAVSASVLKNTADVFVAKGYKDAGYVYVNTDDCWSQHNRTKDGQVQPGLNFGRNADAMKNLSAYIHSKGLKFGIYGAAGMTTCAGRAGSMYHEYTDAATFAEWGVDCK